MGKACTFQAVVTQIQPAQVGGTEVGIGEIDTGSVQFAQVEAAEIATAKINADVLGFFAVEADDLFVMHQRVQCAVQLPWLIHKGASLVDLW
ncbi:hypothetical protein D3C79_985730 [compost metagenome]